MFSDARDIHQAGQIVGSGYPLGRRNAFAGIFACRYTPPAVDEDCRSAADLNLPGTISEALTAIHDSGDVACRFRSPADNLYHALLWPEGTGVVGFCALGGYTSYAAGINDLQSVVGTSDTSTRSSLNRFQAFLRTTTHGMFKLEPQITNLPTSLQLKIRPSRISNTGLICGPGALDPAGTAFLLIPQ